jgi:FkbM family methyltransferase
MIKPVIKAIFHVCGLQLTRLRPPQPPVNALSTLRVGGYAILTQSDEMRRSYETSPEYNKVITRLVLALSAGGRSTAMIDIGANCGDSVALAKSGGPISVLCIEGDPLVCELLRRNVAQFTEVTARKVMLGERVGVVAAEVIKVGWNSTLVTTNVTNPQQIALETLDRVVSDWEALSRLRFIKCDAEGFDVRILLGAENTLAERRPVLLFEYNRDAMELTDEPGFRVFAYLRRLGYARILVYDAAGRFLCASTLKDTSLLCDLHEYADGHNGILYYYDVIVFHSCDEDLALQFIHQERCYRRGSDTPRSEGSEEFGQISSVCSH